MMKRLRTHIKNATTWTPLQINLMLHYYAVNEPWHHPSAPAVIQQTGQLVSAGLLETHEESGSGYIATEKGVAFVEKICNTPLPKAVWE